MHEGLQREDSARAVVETRDKFNVQPMLLLRFHLYSWYCKSITTRYFILMLHRTLHSWEHGDGTAIRTLKQKLDCIVMLLKRIPLPTLLPNDSLLLLTSPQARDR